MLIYFCVVLQDLLHHPEYFLGGLSARDLLENETDEGLFFEADLFDAFLDEPGTEFLFDEVGLLEQLPVDLEVEEFVFALGDLLNDPLEFLRDLFRNLVDALIGSELYIRYLWGFWGRLFSSSLRFSCRM